MSLTNVKSQENSTLKENEKMVKTKEEKLIGHLENVGVEQISTYLRQQGVIVEEHIGRQRIKFSLTNETLGINTESQSEEVQNFLSSHIDLGKLHFIPKQYENQLQKIEQRVRYERKQLAIGYDNKYMPMDSFKKYQEKIKKESEEYMLVRDLILSQWDTILENFKKDLDQTLESLNSINKDKIYKRILSNVPKKGVYQDSFYMYATVKAFPVPENLEMFSPEMQKLMTEGIQEDTLNTLNGILASNLNDAIHSLNLVLKGYKNNTLISVKAIDSVKQAAKKIRSNNVLGHPKVEKVTEELDAIAKEKEAYDAFSMAEALSYSIYGLAKDLDIINLLDYSKFVLSRDDMETNYELFYEEE